MLLYMYIIPFLYQMWCWYFTEYAFLPVYFYIYEKKRPLLYGSKFYFL